MGLPRSQLEAVLRLVNDAYELATPDRAFPPETVARLGDLVPCDLVETFEVDRVRRRELPLTGPQDERWWEIAHQHPICNYVEQTGDFRALTLSDFLTRAELHRLEIYDERMRPHGLEYAIMLALPSPPWHERGFDFFRSRSDFSNRDREVLDVLSPHLLRVFRAVDLQRRLEAALALLDADDADQGVVLLDPNGRVEHATPLARRLLAEFFPGDGVPLPGTVADWLGQGERSLARERGSRRLVVDRVGRGLLVREEPIAAARVETLTPRERQVLEWLSEGKTNAQIAQILVTAPGTVRKHVEHIYAKLGVHTRTAAAAYSRVRIAHAA
jgi:DNA-binding CsgD family transcriptional regulator